MIAGVTADLPRWLRELNLPEPEIAYPVTLDGTSVTLMLAYPDMQLGIVERGVMGETELAGWTLWSCDSATEVYRALVQIGERLGIKPEIRRVDFHRVEAFFASGACDSARDALDELQESLSPGHPDWGACEVWRKRIRKECRAPATSQKPVSPPPTDAMRISTGLLLRADAVQLSGSGSLLPAHNHLGLFTPAQSDQMRAVDAVWAASVDGAQTDLWAATVKGHPTAQEDTEGAAWELVATARLMLEELLRRLGSRATFVWDIDRIQPLLEKWHEQTIGRQLDGVLLVDLRALALVAFPTVKRTDRPESLCEELGLSYHNAQGFGGPLAAQAALLNACAEKLGSLDWVVRAALRDVLALTSLPPGWVDALMPVGTASGVGAYMTALETHFNSLPRPLKVSPGSEETPLPPTEMFFDKGGYLAQGFGSGYRPRGSQRDFALSVAKALTSSAPYLLEAGTGVGKTIGYLVPLLLHEGRSYVATHTKNLQDQAWEKDVPVVLDALSRAGIERKVAILKGKGNYVCLQTVADWLDSLDESLNTSAEAFTFAAVVHWLMFTATGWLSEIESLGRPEIVARLARDQAPPELNATWADIDPHARARDAADEADLVLVNHSYVVALAKYQDPDKADVDTLLFDEAHNLENVVTEALTLDFTPWTLQYELRSLVRRTSEGQSRGLLRALISHPQVETDERLGRFRDAVTTLEQGLDAWCNQARERLAEVCVGEGDFDPDQPVVFPLSMFWALPEEEISSDMPQMVEIRTATSLLADQIDALSLAIEEVLGGFSSWHGLPRRLAGSLGSLLQHLEENLEALRSLLDVEAEDQVHWAEARVRLDSEGQPALIGNAVAWWAEFHSTPIDVAAWLHDTLPPLYSHRLYVSATLTVGDEFTSIIRRLGLAQTDPAQQDPKGVPDSDPAPVAEIFPSPFNYQDQVLLAIPDDTPTPRSSTDPLYLESMSRHIAQLVRVSEGRALVLFTSRKAMRQVQIRLQDELERERFVVLAQTSTNRAAIIERFKAAPGAGERVVLLGLRAFWEGVDVPGDALTILAITRLPFDHFTHPVAVARQRHYRAHHFDADYFREVVVPATFLHLRQMYGRLIRREDDRGVCIMLDPRVVQRSYGRLLLSRLPGSQRVIDHAPRVLGRIQQFLGGEVLPEEPAPVAQAYLLSPEQRAIVVSPARRILVRAAAGSGKTSVLITRITHVIRTNQARPEEVLALTFTNKAQGVMQERLINQLGAQAYELDRNVLTYHKFAARIIRQANVEAGKETVFLNENSPEVQAKLLQPARQEAGLSEKDLNDDDALTVIAYAQNGLVDEAELAAELPALAQVDPFSARLGRFFLAYVRLLREAELLDYGEAIVKAVRILREDSDAAERWSGRFKWIFCDEYQDTNPAQATLLALIGQQARLFVVGDSAQSIYSWQGADPDNLRRFEQDFPNTSSFVLSLNYRCFPNLVDISTHFLEQCSQSQGIPITYDNKRSNDRQSVYYLHSEDDREEARSIVLLAKQARTLDIDEASGLPATVGVLARKWDLLRALEIELIREGVPYKYEGETARGLLAGSVLSQIVQRGAELWLRSETDQVLGDTPESKIVAEIRAGTLTLAAELLDRAQRILNLKSGQDYDYRDYGLLRDLLAGKPAEALVPLAPGGAQENPVVLSTIHSQKGEEFDTVFVLGLEKGNSPHQPPASHARLLEWRRIVQRLSHATWRQTLSDEEMQRIYEQEEERIFYVAMTRARHNLVIGYADRRLYRAYAKSEFLPKAYMQSAVKEVSEPYHVDLAEPEPPDPSDEYRPDGRNFQTDAGVWVRSKSEQLLANEFTRRGIYFEYEQPVEGVANALPDFIFPDYGGYVLEHLGLLGKPDYDARWEIKEQRYEATGIPYTCTTEADIATLPATIERLHRQFQNWAESRYGPERAERIAQVERLRQNYTGFRIGGALDSFGKGLFGAHNASDDSVVAVAVVWDGGDESGMPAPDLPGIGACNWIRLEIPDLEVWIAKLF